MIDLSFRQILEDAKLRVGLSHIRDLKYDHVKALLGDGHVRGHATEKSDGMAYEVGHDEHGFYSRTSRSEKMRHKGDYHAAAKAKFGSALNPEISAHHDAIHHDLHTNENLQKHLRRHGGSIKGEIFHKPQGTPADEHHVRFVGTAYDTRKMGSSGSFIVHSKLPENRSLATTHVHKLGDSKFNFDHDDTGHLVHVDATDLHKRFHELNHEILHSRKKVDAEHKDIERQKFDSIKHALHSRIAHHISKIRPKWGPETEGYVIHPHATNPTAPRVKIVDGNFMARKKAGEKFVKEELLAEGGNVHFGDQKTVPIKIEDRDHKREHVDQFMRSVNKHSGHKIFGKDEKSLNTGSAYSGSSRHMMDKSIPSHELGKHKKTFGDVDVQVPRESESHVVHALTPGTKHGKFTVVGVKKLGAQHSAVVKHEDGSHHQIDFEYKDFHKGEPTKYAQWSQNSHYGDLKSGLKGVMHKHLINAVNSANPKHGIIQTIGKKSTKHEEGEVRDHTFSPQYGMRAKHYPVKDEHGNHLHHEGKPVYSEHTPGSVPYDNDLHSIHHKMFGKKASDVDIDSMHSFHGTASLIKKHLNHEQHGHVIRSFVRKLYGKEDGRPLDNNHEADIKMKDHAIHALLHHFPKHNNAEMHAHIDKSRAEFSAKHNKPLNESVVGKKDDLHIAMAAGRFTGPTREHQKLIDNVLSQKADHHHVFVMGPAEKHQCTEKDPLTVHEKITHLKKLYPDHKHVFVPGTTIHTKTPAAALSWIHFRHKDHAKHLHLHVVAGEGEAGVEKNAGGSIDNYKNMVHRLNGTSFPVRKTEDGKTVGGDKRMDYKSIHFVGQARGTISGSKVRRHAYESDPSNDHHVGEFRKLLHTGVNHEHAREIMKQIKHGASKSLTESRVLGYQERQQRRQNMLRHEPLMQRHREMAKSRMAMDSTLKRRSQHDARDLLRSRIAGLHGKRYEDLSASDKMRVDKMIEKRDTSIRKLAGRLLPKERQWERERLASLVKGASSSYDKVAQNISN